jgi:hypothetical protein
MPPDAEQQTTSGALEKLIEKLLEKKVVGINTTAYCISGRCSKHSGTIATTISAIRSVNRRRWTSRII